MPNRLAQSSSLYLNQHADNPIDWYEWGEEAFLAARSQNKPIFLSVGYSSCHWCHVMAHESFENPAVASFVNEHFISIKVDREERPDVDEIYMTAVQVANGHGGWPMTLFLTPEQEPFFAGTYFPPEPRGEYPGFLTLCSSLAHAWQNDQTEVRRAAREFTQGLSEVLERSMAPVHSQLDPGLLDQAVQTMVGQFDGDWGGFGTKPKFPPHTGVAFLMSYSAHRGLLASTPATDRLAEQAGDMALFTLEKMASGGIHDLVGGGFHRYSTDQKWHLPHFEKMLSDNAQLLGQYARASEIVEDEEASGFFSLIADRIAGWVAREMTSPQGLFYNALDADVDGEEGRTYTWSMKELERSLGAEAARFAQETGAQIDGNFHDESTGRPAGLNILSGLVRAEGQETLDHLLAVRNQRPQPHRDEKCLASANGLMISALAISGHLEPARRAAAIWATASTSFLPHQIVDGKGEGLGFLDDYSCLALGMIDLADATGEEPWRTVATRLADQMVELFADLAGGFYSSSSRHEKLLGRTKPCLDQAVPSGNGLAIRLLRRVGRSEESLLHLSAVLGWAQRMPTATETILEECLETLLLHLPILETAPLVGRGTFVASLRPREVVVSEDGWGYAELLVSIPPGYHINPQVPAAAWLEATRVEVEGVYGEAAFPESNNADIVGEVVFDIRLRLKKEAPSEFELSLTAQLCSESECLAPQTLRLAGVLFPSTG